MRKILSISFCAFLYISICAFPTLLGAALYSFQPVVISQTVSLCTVTGYVFDSQGNPKKGVVIRVRKALKSGVNISVSPTTVTTVADGSFTLTLPRGPESLAWIEGPIQGFNTAGGVPVSVPDSGTATIFLLQAVTSPPGYLNVMIPTQIIIKKDGTLVSNGIGTINFVGVNSASQSPTGQINVDVTASAVHTKTLTDAQIDLFEVALTAGTTAGGIINWSIEASDGTDSQNFTGSTRFAFVNKAGSYTTNVVTTTFTAKSISNGSTLSATFAGTSGTNKVTVSVTPAGSLTETTYRIFYTVTNTSSQTLTFL